MKFVYEPLPGRIVFGAGSIAGLRGEAERLGCRRVLVLTTPGQEAQGRRMLDLLGPCGTGLFAGARMHTPIEVTEAAMAVAEAHDADGLVSFGGGSTTGLGKAIALRTDLPQIVIPTTYAGSEVTPILGETSEGVKTTQRSAKILPETVIYDVDLTLGLPAATSATSGLNAIAHAVEALYAQDRNPIVDLVAEEGVRALVAALPAIIRDPRDKAAREKALYGAWLCGTCLGAVGMALHHKLCHTLGGSFDLPHAETHSVILPHALAFNLPFAPDARERLARAIGSEDPAAGLHLLAHALGAPTALRALGMPEVAIDRAADLAVQNPYWNPRPIERDALRDLIARAWRGAAPEASIPPV
jgi:alcohol dehydrogenase class IV